MEEEGDDEEDAAEDEGDDFETAWEILDSARAILCKEKSEERQLQLARIHCSMAEVATEAGKSDRDFPFLDICLGLDDVTL